MADLVPIGPAALALSMQSARTYAKAAKSPATRRAYRTSWGAFVDWCGSRNFSFMPAAPDTVAVYIAKLADEGRKVATIEKVLAAISEAQRAGGYPSPRASAPVRSVLQGIRRTKLTAQRQVSPIVLSDLRAMVSTLPKSLKGIRDRAILLLGFAGAFRRSELVGLDVADFAVSDDGLTVTLRKSKTDQDGAGRKVGIPRGGSLCPVRAVVVWLEWRGDAPGSMFGGLTRHGKPTGLRLDGKDIANLIKSAAEAAGLDPTKFSGHSLRAGLVTTAARAGKSERAIMGQTGHKSVTMVRRYIRDAGLFDDNAADGIGL